MCDYHVHTIFSPDSRQSMAGQCARAAALGLREICFTEHMDFDAPSLGYYDAEAYFKELNRLRERYAGRLRILAGLEFSEAHRHPEALAEAQTRPYDFILGSVHYWIGGLFPSQMAEQGMDVRRCFALYWDEMLRMVRCGGFDCVAHLDFPKRYFHALHYGQEKLDEIFSVMRQNGLILEINSSSLRMGCGEPMPGRALLERYKAHGGKYVTLGSDAHTAAHLGAGLEEAKALADAMGFVALRFRARKADGKIC
jgi:histidinol-phosphatase (PHP family)